MAFYEIVFIIRPDVSTQQAEAVAGKLADVAVAKGGKVIKSEQWGLRTLAYRIKKHRKGYYVLLGVSGTGEVVAEIERQVTISDDIIRHLVVRVDELTKEPSVQLQYKARAERTGRPMAGRVDEGFDVETV